MSPRIFFWTSVICLLMTSSTVSPYRILGIFPHFGKSHFLVIQPLIQELSERGHDVTLLSTHPTPSAAYKDLVLEWPNNTGGNHLHLDTYSPSYFTALMEVVQLRRWGQESCEPTLKSVQVQELLKLKKQFDVIIIQTFNTYCYLGLVHRLQTPFILFSSSSMMPWLYSSFGQPNNPSYIHNIFMGFSSKMNFWQRVLNTFSTAWYIVMLRYYIMPDDYKQAKSAFGENLPQLDDIARNASMCFVNDHFTLHQAKPSVPGVLGIGGIHVAKKVIQELPKNIEKWINESTEGVIYFSMGSMIKGHTFPEEKRKAFIRAFARVKQRVLWKWENETMPEKPDNVMIQKWMPQFDILSHPNVKVFISHGGLLGTTEAVHCGVPMIVLPQYGDQHANARAMESNGGGIMLNFKDTDEEMVYNALKTVLDPEFNKKAKELSVRFRDRPMSPMDTAIYWIEYVARHKGAHHMRTAAVGMPLYQYLLLDVIGFLALLILSILFIAAFGINFIFRMVKTVLFSGDENKEKQKKY